ncbi:hypothetical protein BD311DRAFT_391288 [Dichomitus squalens]|uniref:Uncharacterized protein n=1 Tax=Dichomitus squalens TaxID=114155 RepID=A0A4Q9N1M3_9APHY|nr:hypothetical protein BD311DRAFT_391288 [Dichomitus squalens]
MRTPWLKIRSLKILRIYTLQGLSPNYAKHTSTTGRQCQQYFHRVHLFERTPVRRGGARSCGVTLKPWTVRSCQCQVRYLRARRRTRNPESHFVGSRHGGV